jgi:hypothetical protein
MNADPKREAPTSVGASSSGTAFSRGGNSCNATFHGKCYSDPSAPQSGRLPNPLSQTCPMGPNSGRLRYA